MSKKKIPILFAVLLCVLALVFCALRSYISSPNFSGSTFSQQSASHGGLYLEGDRILASSSPNLHISGTTATITGGGLYELSGHLDNGCIIVEAGPEDEVTLKLDGVSILSDDSPAIWVKSAGKVKIKLPEDTVNYLQDSTFYTLPDPEASAPNACIYSRADLTIKGSGSLTVKALFDRGIATTDDLKITGGMLTVTAPGTALRGKDSIQITGGTLDLSAGEDGLRTSGSLLLEDCTLRLLASRYGLKGVSSVRIGEAVDVTLTAPFPIGCMGEISGEERLRLIPLKSEPLSTTLPTN